MIMDSAENRDVLCVLASIRRTDPVDDVDVIESIDVNLLRIGKCSREANELILNALPRDDVNGTSTARSSKSKFFSVFTCDAKRIICCRQVSSAAS